MAPFLDLGRRLEASSLRVAKEFATESWLLLLTARRRKEPSCGLELVVSKLLAGEEPPLALIWPRDGGGCGGV